MLGKLRKALGEPPGHYPRALEIGAGTGYFTLNLVRAGVIERAVATDISPGMLRRLSETADQLGLEVEAVEADAEALPFPDASFDLVMGHAVLHHLPDLRKAMSEFERVLASRRDVAFMGEPSRHGDRLAIVPKWVGGLVEPRVAPRDERRAEVERAAHRPTRRANLRRARGTRRRAHLRRGRPARPGGRRRIHRRARVRRGAAGQHVRLVPAPARVRRGPESVPRAWHNFAFRSYLALQSLDGRLLEPRLPANLFYNLMVSGRKPA